MKLKVGIVLIILMSLVVGFVPLTARDTSAASAIKPACVFYFGGWSTSIRDRLMAGKPEYVVLDLSTWPNIAPSDIALCKSAGITVCAYIPTGGMRGYTWNGLDTTDKTPAGLDRLIDRAANIGINGVFFDEGGLYTPISGQTYQDAYLNRTLAAPGSGAGGGSLPILSVVGNPKYNAATANAWTGLTAEYYINHAKIHNMFTIVGCPDEYVRPSRINSNIFPIVNAVLTSEEYNTRAPGLAPVGQEKLFTDQCFVLSYSGSYDTVSTNSAIDYGFGAAYCCVRMNQLPSPAFENYMAALTVVAPPPTTTTPPPGQTTVYSLTIAAQGQGSIFNNGVLLTPGTYQIPASRSVSLAAVPAPGYTFRTWTWPTNWLNNPEYKGWSSNPTTWTMTEPVSIIAVFDKATNPQYTINISVSGQGTTNPAGIVTTNQGSTLSITATPANGYAFSGWTGSISSTNPTISFIANANMNLQAVFIPTISYILTVGTQGSGSVFKNGKVLSPGTYQIPANELLSLVAVPASGYKFRTWTWPSNWLSNPGYAGWKENPTVFTMVKPISIIAVFDKIV